MADLHSDQGSHHPFGVPETGDFHCGRCGTLLDGGTDEPVAARELRAENERLHAMLTASEEHTQHHEAEAERFRDALHTIATGHAFGPVEVARSALGLRHASDEEEDR